MKRGRELYREGTPDNIKRGYTDLVYGGENVTVDDGVISAAAGGGAELPEVSAEDNGDVLTVVNGEWSKATPSGGLTLYGPYYASNAEQVSISANSFQNNIELTDITDDDGTPRDLPNEDFKAVIRDFGATAALFKAVNSPGYYEGSYAASCHLYNPSSSSITEDIGRIYINFYSTVEFPAGE